ncbi:aspartate/glutamate racemase family protein [Streptomyces sp. AC495_CC817]|uniref:aspartate/glutamate racemase family protein n=1 Tax=Streptomyces sp. AC495_CC817 TaxID=2823900 RepID=UPI001C25B576|nr:amino acid racemase [Streptomyces sp. AC495_CC817]
MRLPALLPFRSAPATRSSGSPLLGVLGGMGPLATARFYEALVAATPARSDQDHIRTVIWSDPTIPDRSDAILGDGPSPLPAMTAGAARLRRMGADLLATPCNTAHRFLPEVSRATGLRAVDMIDESMARAATTGARHVGVLATRGTRVARLYDAAGDRRGIRTTYPHDDAQSRFVDSAIAIVKRGGDRERAEQLLEYAAESMRHQDVDVLIAACTELPLVMARASRVATVIDSIDCLARACVRELRPAPLAVERP